MPELICDRCKQNYPIWSTDNESWNSIIRNNPSNFIFEFLCPTCFCFLGTYENNETWFIKPERASKSGEAATRDGVDAGVNLQQLKGCYDRNY